MASMIDLDAYFDRIRWGGGTDPTFEVLSGLLDAHMRHIPFENLDVLLGRPIKLDLDSLQEKLVRSHRGGYCFEHGTLFAAVLEQLGFRLVRHIGRAVFSLPRSAAPRTHMFLTVPFAEGAFVVDPGFGGLAPRVPVPLVDGKTVRHPNSSHAHRMVYDGPYWVLKVVSPDKEVEAWVSTFDLDNAVDFEVANHFTATHPNSSFVNRLMLRAFTETGRVSVRNRDVTKVTGGVVESMQLVDRKQLRELLASHFGFDLPEVEGISIPSIPEWSR